jgi:uncharacterized DUF497 family protein
MPYFDLFLWEEQNAEHVAHHGVTTAEFEYVVLNAKKAGTSQSSGRPIVFGVTEAGRKLACVYEVIDDLYCYPITAYDIE